jgi:small subunit ribosomal protein S16
MALVIRMRQQGAKNRQTFRVVVTDERCPRDGKYIEKLGWYNPLAANESNVLIDSVRMQFWLDNGAKISDRVMDLVARAAPDVAKQMVAKKIASREKARAKRNKT